MKLLNRYSSAIVSDRLTVDPDTTWSDTDVLGAAGLSAKRRPLPAAVLRLLAGDYSTIPEIRATVAQKVEGRAWHTRREKIAPAASYALSRAIVGWWADGRCKPCSGRGAILVEGTARLGKVCSECRGGGKTPLERIFKDRDIGLVRWAIGELDAASSQAQEGARAKLAGSWESKLAKR